MISRIELTHYLDRLLDCANYQDYAPNGLQVEGRLGINKIATAVTASLEIIEKALTLRADALIVHHGYFWKGEDNVITGIKKNRLKALLENDLNLFAYHLPLDCHLEFGNNAILGKIFGLNEIKSHKVNNIDNLLWSGKLSKPMSLELWAGFIEKELNRPLQIIKAHNKPIKNISWCSGAAEDLIYNAARLGADVYLSGEVSERTYYEANELNINYLVCGHHATERYGIKALGEKISAKFKIKNEFIDAMNPI